MLCQRIRFYPRNCLDAPASPFNKMPTTSAQNSSLFKNLQNTLKIGPSYGPNIFNSSPVEALILLGVALPVLFVALVALLHSATALVYVVGPMLHKVLIPVAAIVLVLAVPALKIQFTPSSAC